MSSVDKDVLLEWAFGLTDSLMERDVIKSVIEGCDAINLPECLTDSKFDTALEDGEEIDENNLYALIGEMGIPEKIKLALFGNQTARTLLLRDTSNRQIPLLVLENPRITDVEIMEIAKNPNMDERVLRAIGADGNRMKSYSLKLAIVSNPKVPVDVSLKWLKHIRDRDLRFLSRSKNVPQVINTQSRKLIQKRSDK